MLRFLICSLLLAASPLLAQSDPLVLAPEDATTLHLSAYFSTVEITTGTGSDVRITHTVTVNGKPRPDLARVDVNRAGGKLTVTETSPRESDLSQEHSRETVTINGNKIHGRTDSNISVSMVVEVPPGMKVTVETHYGGVTATDVSGLEDVNATYGNVTVVFHSAARPAAINLFSNYGDVDLALPNKQGADLELITEYGQLLTDFDINIDTEQSKRQDFYERVVGSINGGGARVQCRAPYQNVYLRAAE